MVEQFPNGVGLRGVVIRQWLAVHGAGRFYRGGNRLPIKKLRHFRPPAGFFPGVEQAKMDSGGPAAKVGAT